MNRVRIVSCLLALLFPALASGWPIDGYPDTGIRRLEEQRLIAIGELPGSGQPPGGRWPTSAVDIRLVAEVPLGAFLSGGVDSSAVVAAMAQFQEDPVNTCAIGPASGPSTRAVPPPSGSWITKA